MNIVTPYARIMKINGHEPYPNSGVEALRFVEFCARVSHASEDAQTADSWRRFIEFVVMTKGDWSVTEHVNVTVDFLVDRGITHELVRHRLASYTQSCISGDTRLTGNLTIRQAFERNLVGRKIRSSDGKVIVKNKIQHIFDKGTQPVYEVKTEGGYRIKATMAHEFQTPSGGFCRLESIAPGDQVMVNGRPCLLRVDDNRLRSLFFESGLSAAEIAESEGSPYPSVTRRLRQLGLFRDYRNDKNKEKYNRNHTSSSHAKMRSAVIEGYRKGRHPWNHGLTCEQSPAVARSVAAMNAAGYRNGCGPLNSNWKGGVRKTQRMEARRLKKHVKQCEVCHAAGRLEVHHIDETPSNNAIENLVKLCYPCHRKVHSKFRIGIAPIPDRISSITYVGEEHVFDLEMQTHHNYVANGFVVHNSTRFINYDKRMPPTFVKPFAGTGTDEETARANIAWENAIECCAVSYREFLRLGMPPQIARSVLPNALSSRILVTANLRSWRQILIMRTTKETHPQFRQVSVPLLREFQDLIPILYSDIEPEQMQGEAIKRAR